MSTCTDDTASMLDAVREYLDERVKFATPDGAAIVALWVAHTWIIESDDREHDESRAVWFSPRLLIEGDGPGSGKSTLLDYIRHLSRNPIKLGKATAAALWRAADVTGQPTMLLDEIDAAFRAADDGLRGIINDGFAPGNPRHIVTTTGKGEHSVAEQSAYFPLAIAGNNVMLADDSATRTIGLALTTAAADDVLNEHQRYMAASARPHAEALAAWAVAPATRDGLDMHRALNNYGNGRQANVWESLRLVADVVGSGWSELAIELQAADAVRRDTGEGDGLNAHLQFVRDALDAWPESTWDWGTVRMLDAMAERSPATWGKGGKYGQPSPKQVGSWLRLASVAIPHLDVRAHKVDDLFDGRARGRRRDVFATIARHHGLDVEPHVL